MTTTDRTLFVTWYDPTGRSIWPVGRLVHTQVATDAMYEFRYIRAVQQAREHGFLPFLAFPELYKVYRSRELFPFFTNRVMPTTRPDYIEYVRALGLDPDNTDSIAILARNGGKRETDRIEVVPKPSPDETGAYITHFLVRGIRYIPGGEECVLRLESSEQVYWMLDAQNEANPDAVALRSADKQLFGYVPDYLTTDVAQLIQNKAALQIFVERVNPPPAPLHHRLLCRIEARWPVGFVPFQHQRFDPLDLPTEAGIVSTQPP